MYLDVYLTVHFSDLLGSDQTQKNNSRDLKSKLKKHFSENLSKTVKKVFVVTQELKRKGLQQDTLLPILSG
jgi:hypothetical protein